MRLGNVIEINPEQARREYPYEEIKYIDISSVGTGILHDTKNIQFANAPSRAKRIVRNGDTLLATVRPNLRSFWFAQNIGNNTIASTGFAILRATEEADPRFIYYTVTNQCFTDYLTANTKGAAYPAVDTETIERAEVYLPPLSIQSKIAAILSAYDDLIENNLRRIKILEEMAQNLYREWFVNFRFPGHENTHFVDSPLGQIPEGWEVLEFRNLFDIKYGKTLSKTKISKYGLYPVYGAGDIIGYYDEMICEKKCVLVTSRGNGSGTVWRTRGAAFVTNNSLIIKPKPYFNHWGYTFIELLLKNSNVMEAKTGSAQPQVTIENLNYVKSLVPESKCVERFCEITLPINELIDRYLIKNTILRQTRDLLLPKLISGEVDVSELDINTTGEQAI
jgi:type I restriction enzyme, S subunit